MRCLTWLLLTLLVTGGCADRVDNTVYNDAVTDPQLPARGPDAMATWLAGGYYKSWRCEPAGHPARNPSPHPRNRICSNDALHGSSDGAFSVGAASVKELLDSADRITGYAVIRKTADSDGGKGWYWYEASGSDVAVAEHNADSCVGCHSHAPRDFVFTIVP